MDTINHQDFSKLRTMKVNYIIIYLLCLSSIGFAQNRKLKQANKLYDNKAYSEAAVLFSELDENQETLLKLGDCYYYNSQMTEAISAYKKLFTQFKDSLNTDVYFRYAHAMYGEIDYDNADLIMSEYLGNEINTTAFIEKLDRGVPYNYEIEAINTGTSSGDFGISYYGDTLVFASLRNSDNPNYEWNGKPYLDLYQAIISEYKNLENIKPFSDKINSKTHESNAVFSKDGKTMYFSRTNDKRIQIGEEKYAPVKIYRAELIDNEWQNITPTPFSSDMYSTQHPALNEDGSRLYFSSDMPGSNGSFDIYYVEINGDTYSDPINLGSDINTKHLEQFPFISNEGVLYFASNGHQGLGGLDVFMSYPKDSIFSTPLNVGKTLNSGLDDFGFILKDSLQEGFFSSNRNGVDKIFAFKRTENIRVFTVEGDVRDKNTKAILPGTTVTLLNVDGTIAGEMIVGEDGKYTFETEPNKTYKIEGYRDFYIPTIEEFTTNDEGKIEINIELEIESYDDAEEIVVTKPDGYIYIELENIYFDLDKWDIKPQAARTLDVLVNLLKKYPRMEVQLGAHTDSRSSEEYNLNLSNNRANATLEYLISNGISRSRLESKGFGESQPLVDCGDNCTEVEYAINRRCEFIILK
jgi:outer membrane protein OmpA-like peptidoglycan-associated protein